LNRLGKVDNEDCDLPGNEFWVGGEIVRTMDGAEKTRLDEAGVHLYANPEQLFEALADAFLGGSERVSAA
jgi:CRISPR-associated protein Cst2